MSESALEAPRPAPAPPVRPRPVPPRGLLRGRFWWLSALALVAVSIALVRWAGTRPSYDAYGWLVWGYQTLHGTLDLGGSPSWKPLPFLFTVPFALAGRAQMWLWMYTAVTLSLAGCLFAARIAYRLTLAGTAGNETAMGSPRLRGAEVSRAVHLSALLAGALAAAALLGIEDYLHYVLSVQSDPVIVTCVLGAIDQHLCGRRRWAFALLWLASLGRPEAWPWLALYAVWGWRALPAMRGLILAGAVALLFLWFGVPAITNGRPFVSAQLAFNSPRALRHDQIFGTIGRFHELLFWPTWVAAGAAVALAAYRRNRLVLALAAGTAGWIVVEIAFALHGWPGLQRYMFEPAAVTAVLAGAAVGWALVELPRWRARIPAATALAIAAAFVIAMVPGAVSRLRVERSDLRHERARARQIALLLPTIDALGGPAHIRACAIPAIDIEWMSPLGWSLDMDIGYIYYHPARARRSRYPLVVFRPLRRLAGWSTRTYHLRGRTAAACQSLNAEYVGARPGVPAHVRRAPA